jgi:probable rRNA maturation factor
MPVELSDPDDLLAGATSAGVSGLETAAAFVLEHLDRAAWELSVCFVGDDAMQALNRDWRGNDSTTDVLSFSQTEGESLESGLSSQDDRHLGDVVISVTRAEQQARDGGWTIEEEMSRLLLHGILHLLGYDHEAGASEAKRMRQVESATAAAMVAAGLPCAREAL